MNDLCIVHTILLYGADSNETNKKKHVELNWENSAFPFPRREIMNANKCIENITNLKFFILLAR